MANWFLISDGRICLFWKQWLFNRLFGLSLATNSKEPNSALKSNSIYMNNSTSLNWHRFIFVELCKKSYQLSFDRSVSPTSCTRHWTPPPEGIIYCVRGHLNEFTLSVVLFFPSIHLLYTTSSCAGPLPAISGRGQDARRRGRHSNTEQSTQETTLHIHTLGQVEEFFLGTMEGNWANLEEHEKREILAFHICLFLYLDDTKS